MNTKTAVHCRTKKEFIKVCDKMGGYWYCNLSHGGKWEEINRNCDYIRDKTLCVNINNGYDDKVLWYCYKDWYKQNCFIIISAEEYLNEVKKINKEDGMEMDSLIVELYPQTKDAILVNKYFGKEITALTAVLLKGKESELLETAKKMEEENNKK